MANNIAQSDSTLNCVMFWALLGILAFLSRKLYFHLKIKWGLESEKRRHDIAHLKSIRCHVISDAARHPEQARISKNNLEKWYVEKTRYYENRRLRAILPPDKIMDPDFDFEKVTSRYINFWQWLFRDQ